MGKMKAFCILNLYETLNRHQIFPSFGGISSVVEWQGSFLRREKYTKLYVSNLYSFFSFSFFVVVFVPVYLYIFFYSNLWISVKTDIWESNGFWKLTAWCEQVIQVETLPICTFCKIKELHLEVYQCQKNWAAKPFAKQPLCVKTSAVNKHRKNSFMSSVRDSETTLTVDYHRACLFT